MTYVGESAAEALKNAYNECGEEALVVSTKQIRKKALGQNPLFEVVVAYEESKSNNSNSVKAPIQPPFVGTHQNTHQSVQKESHKASQRTMPNHDSDVKDKISEALKQISQISQPNKEDESAEVKEISQNFISKSVADKNQGEQNINFGDIKGEIAKLADKVKTIQHMIWEEKLPQRGHLVIPPEFSEIYKIAKTSGMDPSHLDSIMKLTLEHMPSKMKEKSDAVKRYFRVLLSKMIPIRIESDVRRSKKRAIMFVGPTGVGKTTTLAKLAGKYTYVDQKRQKVGIITLDTYRIGAVEQLFSYAKMMKLPIEDVVDINDFNHALRSLNSCDVILIDTVGSSQYDREKLEKLENFLKKSEIDIDVNLVLSCATKLDDLLEIYKNFSFIDIDTLIFTKFDETKGFGNVFSLVYETNRPISYFSVGQEVPDDLMEAQSEYLIECLLDGYKKGKK